MPPIEKHPPVRFRPPVEAYKVDVPVEKLATLWMEKMEPGEVVAPTPTLPAWSTINLVPVDEPMTKLGMTPSPTTGLIESFAQGEVLASPRNPVAVRVVVAVPPKEA